MGAGTILGANIGSYRTSRQINTTNSTETNQIIQAGIGVIPGVSGVSISEAVTFPEAFGDIPVVLGNALGFLSTAEGFNPSAMTSWGGQTAVASEPKTTGFTMRMQRNDGGTYSTSTNYYYSWVAIGRKA